MALLERVRAFQCRRPSHAILCSLLYCGCYTLVGMALSSLGPALLNLAAQTGADIGEISCDNKGENFSFSPFLTLLVSLDLCFPFVRRHILLEVPLADR